MGAYGSSDWLQPDNNDVNEKQFKIQKKRMKKCKTCEIYIAKNAKTCPNCGAKNKNGCAGCLGAILMFFGIIFIIAAISSSGGDDSGSAATITKVEFDMLKDGMTYQQCVDIVGGEGFMSTEATMGSIKMTMYSWKGNGSLGSNANATFYDGKLTSKTQVGLE